MRTSTKRSPKSLAPSAPSAQPIDDVGAECSSGESVSVHEPNTGMVGVGLSDPGIAKARRQMLDLVNRMKNTGVQNDIDLPQIAVIGNQSAGKSSLIESISGITLPRAAGTCTRCPTEIRLSHADDSIWGCIVELRVITDKNGQPLGQARNERFGEPITDRADVEDRIRRAQRAILNPSKPARSFLSDDEDENEPSELSFSTNYISLQITGPDISDLAFVDLPGLIASVSRGGDNRDIKMVENLVASYISKPSCVILLTVACETDFENQGAHNLTKQYDPLGKRTIGVLTKPDRIPSGEESNWIPFIRNEQETLENNWYCVKQPSSQDIKLGITWQNARSAENDFFSFTSPWSELDQMYQKYLRTTNLVDRLSSILSDLISKRLPEIQVELEKTIQKTLATLQQLPKPPSPDPIGEVAGMMHSLVDEINRVIDGVPTADGLLQVIRPAQESFRSQIRATAPDFRPFESGSPVIEDFHEPQFLTNEDGQSSGMTTLVAGREKPIFIDEVMQRATAARTRELPGHHPFVVQTSFISEVTQKWALPAQVLCRMVHSALSQHIRDVISKQLGSFGQGALEQRVTQVASCRILTPMLTFHRLLMQEHLRRCSENAQNLIAKLISLEQSGSLTLNEHYLADYRSKFLSFYKQTRQNSKNPGLARNIQSYKSVSWGEETDISTALSNLAAVGLQGVKAEDLVKLLPPDRMDAALEIMSDVRAYFQVAYKRITDNVPLAIDYELIRAVGRDLLPTLYSGLGINGPEGLRICPLASFTSASETQYPFHAIDNQRSTWDFDVEPNPNATGQLVFDTVSSFLQHWPNTRYRNGHNIVPGIVPIGTLLYHGRADSNLPTVPEWTATDPEHSYLFCWGSSEAGCWHLTLVATRPLRVLYFDGSSAAKMPNGPMDSQDVISWGKVIPERYNEERVRIVELCNWGKDLGIDGFLRMEMDFEIMLCDFTAGVDVLSMSNLASPRRAPPRERDDDRFGVQDSVDVIQSGSWHNRYPGDRRVQLDLSRLVSFYDTGLVPSLVAVRFNRTRWDHRLLGISDSDTAAVHQRLIEAYDSSMITQGSGIDWDTLFKVVVDRYAERLELVQYVLSNSTRGALATAKRATGLFNVMLAPYLIHSAKPGSRVDASKAWASPIFEFCATSHTSYMRNSARVYGSLTAAERLLLDSAEEVNHEICRVVVGLWADGVVAGLDDMYPADSGFRPVDEAVLVERWRTKIAALITWLDWSVWVKCKPACSFEEFCYLPTWPYFNRRAEPRPQSPPPRPPWPPVYDDDILHPQPRCLRRLEPYAF
ncbi:unnamed protein product [Mycena citricolor]|uniref:Dynamin-type G domain-containing protein n=1 Tax=Mycena citricolor TaxID=2018698 RepID=A0AAD2HG76_9AGAR|nr:unnamed protein product [Mycena citricolor]